MAVAGYSITLLTFWAVWFYNREFYANDVFLLHISFVEFSSGLLFPSQLWSFKMLLQCKSLPSLSIVVILLSSLLNNMFSYSLTLGNRLNLSDFIASRGGELI